MGSHLPTEDAQLRAQARSEKVERQRLEAERAHLQEQADRDARDAKTQRLRALRLANEAQEAKAAPVANPAAKAATSPSKSKAAAGKVTIKAKRSLTAR